MYFILQLNCTKKIICWLILNYYSLMNVQHMWHEFHISSFSENEVLGNHLKPLSSLVFILNRNFTMSEKGNKTTFKWLLLFFHFWILSDYYRHWEWLDNFFPEFEPDYAACRIVGRRIRGSLLYIHIHYWREFYNFSVFFLSISIIYIYIL